MKRTICLIVFTLTLFAFSSCATESIDLDRAKVSEPVVVATPERIDAPINVNEDMAIAATISAAVYGTGSYDGADGAYRSVDAFDPTLKGNWIVFQRQTIRAPLFAAQAEIPEDLMSDFTSKNEVTAKLRNDYDVKFGLKVSKKTGDLAQLFADANKGGRGQDLRAAIALSQVGFDAQHKRSLVYLEFYNPKVGLQGKFFLIAWRKDGKGIMKDSVTWFDVDRSATTKVP